MAANRQDQIHRIETLAKDAWPAALEEPLDGWRLRFTYGITRRANSVWPNGEDGRTVLDVKLHEAELFYAVYEMPVRFQISPAVHPVDLDIVLAMRGYQRSAETAVQTATIDAVLSATGQRLPEPAFKMEVAETFQEEWFQTYCAIEHFGTRAAAVRRDIVQRIRSRTGFALARVGDEPVALGLGVANGEWLGVFGMATHESVRRRGAATSVLHALTAWAQAYSVRQVYLQVMLVNGAALNLYAQCGFNTLYHYHYREKSL